MRGAGRFDPAQNSEAWAMYRHLAQNINIRDLLQTNDDFGGQMVRRRRAARRRALRELCELCGFCELRVGGGRCFGRGWALRFSVLLQAGVSFAFCFCFCFCFCFICFLFPSRLLVVKNMPLIAPLAAVSGPAVLQPSDAKPLSVAGAMP